MAAEFNRAVARLIATCAYVTAVAIQQFPALYDPALWFLCSSNRTPAYPPSLSLTALFSFSLKQNASLRARKSTALAGVGVGDEVCFIGLSREGRCLLATGKHFLFDN
jgi:hypothetical protein